MLLHLAPTLPLCPSRSGIGSSPKNLPIGAVTFLMFGLFLHEGQAPRRHWIDYLGSALMMFGAGALMLALVQVGNSGEMATIASLAAGGVVALLALAAHERGAARAGHGRGLISVV